PPIVVVVDTAAIGVQPPIPLDTRGHQANGAARATGALPSYPAASNAATVAAVGVDRARDGKRSRRRDQNRAAATTTTRACVVVASAAPTAPGATHEGLQQVGPVSQAGWPVAATTSVGVVALVGRLRISAAHADVRVI